MEQLAAIAADWGIALTPQQIDQFAAYGAELRRWNERVNLTAITDAAVVLATIAQILDLRESAGRAWIEILRNALRDKQLLLVLDNFEQVVAAAVDLVALLASAAQIKILITSREILRLSAEHVVAVPPLALPERMARLPITQFSQSHARFTSIIPIATQSG